MQQHAGVQIVATPLEPISMKPSEAVVSAPTAFCDGGNLKFFAFRTLSFPSTRKRWRLAK